MRGMEYAIAGGVTALFIIIYLVTRPKPRERFTAALNEQAFAAYAKERAESLCAPANGGKEPDTAPMKKKVKRALALCDKECDDEGLLRLLLILKERKEDLAALAKEDFSRIADLPYANGKARAVTLAETVLCPSRYIFVADRAETAFAAFNAVRTLTFTETENMREAFRLVLLEKLSFICGRIAETERMMRAARRVARHPRLARFSRAPKIMKGSIFSYFCAGELGYDTEKFAERYLALTDETAFLLSNVIDSLDNTDIFDFSEYYEPVNILAHYDAYVSASPETRAAFMRKLGELSGAENLDEYAYALRLEGYGGYGKLPPLTVRRVSAGKGSAVLAHFDGDLVMLARALSSKEMMEMLFGQSRKGGSILKNQKIKNSFMPKTKVVLADFGLTVEGDTLTAAPSLPDKIVSAECVVSHKGVDHRVRIVRGEPGLVVNGTEMSGVPFVTLGDIPSEIIFTVKG